MHEYRNGSLLDVERVIENNAKAVELAKAQGVPVFYTRHCYRAGYPDAGPGTLGLFTQMGATPLIRGTWDADIVDELSRGEDGVVVDKSRFDGFYNTDLEILLKRIGGKRLVVTGIVTNVCVETTVRAATVRDFDVTVLEDCCSTYTAEHQQGAFNALESYMFARVASLTTPSLSETPSKRTIG